MLTLHDIGKFAVTFQNLRPDLLLITQHRQTQKSADPTNRHDTSGFGLWKHILAPNLQKLGFITLGSARRATPQSQAINIWMSAVTGHHGTPPKSVNHAQVSQDFETTDQHAASAFLKDVSELLLGDSRPFPVEDGDQRDNILIKPVRFAVDRHPKNAGISGETCFCLRGSAIHLLAANPRFKYIDAAKRLRRHTERILRQHNKISEFTYLKTADFVIGMALPRCV